MKVLIINGAPRSGKDTFIDFVVELTNSVYSYSSIDWVKEKARGLGWDGEKDKKGRKFLSDIKDACTKYDDRPFRRIIDHMNIAYGSSFDFFCVNIREPQEIEKLVSYCKAVKVPCDTIRVINWKAEKEAEKINNTGDNGYMNYSYDFYPHNNGSLDEFRGCVSKSLEYILEGDEVVEQ